MNGRKRLDMVLAVCVFLALLAAPAAGRTIYVDPNGSADFNTIQAAIDDPCTVNGDDIEVAPATYYEAINFNGKAIRLYSSDGPNVTTIDANGAYHVVQCVSGEDANTILAGFTITGGFANGIYPDNVGGGMYNDASSPTVTNCTFSGNSADYGGGMYNDSSSPTLTNCTFTGNTASYGGGMRNSSSSPMVTNCTFSGNTASDDGGGMENWPSSSPTVTNCTFSGNSAPGYGGGMDNWTNSNPTVTNCTFSGNSSNSGGAMYNSASSSSMVTNCILWGDTPDEISNLLGSTTTVNYSDVQGASVYPGTGNINADPCFVDADSNDFHLLANSPCIDVGDNDSVPADTADLDGDGNTTEPIPFDLDGNPRILGNVVDMGAYEDENPEHTLMILSTANGSVSEPGEGNFQYPHGTVVAIVAEADPCCGFVEWTGTAVDAGKVADACTASTTVTVDADYTLAANFFRTVFFVDGGASGNNDGSSWADAYNYLQDALAAAGCDSNILVAQGIYYPDANSANPAGANKREATFQLINGVAIYGGFPSGGGDWQSRDPNAYETILSGDINVPGDASDNSYHVVQCVSGEDANTILAGFTITGGNANGGSHPHWHGGGMYNDGSSPTVTDCNFSGNSANEGGSGMYNEGSSSPTVTNCTFSGNSADHGGGMYNSNSCSTTVSNCTFSSNLATGGIGGGMYNLNWSSPAVTNCTFSGNWAATNGGGMDSRVGSNPTVTNCTFSQNTADTSGGGMFNYQSSPTVTNCILWNNTPDEIYNNSSSPTVNYSDIQGGWGGAGGNNINADPCFVDADSNDFHLLAKSACIDAGDNNSLPPDTADLDGDGNTAEPIPFDADGGPRVLDGNWDGNSVVDMGAYECQVDYLVVDDMESYDETDNWISDTWNDGLWNSSGSFIWLGVDPCEPVHTGDQSMVFVYDNTGFWMAYHSEIDADPFYLEVGTDWTQWGVKSLTIYFYGDPNNDANDTEQMYVGLEDTSGAGSYAEVRYGDYGEDMNDIKKQEWTEWNIALSDFNDVILTDVAKVVIGFGDRTNPWPAGTPGGSGIVYFDDIRLYPPRCFPEKLKLAADLTGDCAVDYEDISIVAQEWLTTGVLADLYEDGNVDFRDYAIVAEGWLEERLWPEP